jgi:hypothetical protein
MLLVAIQGELNYLTSMVYLFCQSKHSDPLLEDYRDSFASICNQPNRGGDRDQGTPLSCIGCNCFACGGTILVVHFDEQETLAGSSCLLVLPLRSWSVR